MKKIRISAVLWAMIASIAMILVGLVGIVPQAQATMPANTVTASGAASTTNRNVTIIAFQQNWKSIAKECTETYGPEGVGYVEVSPPSESIKGSQWWTSYQPVSYKLDSKEGTEADFKQMIATCKAAGVGIIADAVINHTTGVDHPANVGVDGSKFDAQGNFPAIGYTKGDFHDCAKNIGNYNDANEVWNCRLTGLQDLNTSKAQVQDKIADYMKHLLDDGVAGFRVDAVKHMDPKDVSAIKAKLAQKSGMAEDKIYWNQETLGNANEDPRIQPSNYVSTGEVHEMNFPYRLKTAFNGGDGNVSGLKDLSSKLLPSQEASVFVSNWDTERNASTLNYKDGSRYLLANAFMLAYGYGTPYINSGYKFEDSAAGHDAGGSRGNRYLRARYGLLHRFRLALHPALDGHPGHDRLPQRRQRRSDKLVVQRVDGHRLRPRDQWLPGHQQFRPGHQPDLHYRHARRRILRRLRGRRLLHHGESRR